MRPAARTEVWEELLQVTAFSAGSCLMFAPLQDLLSLCSLAFPFVEEQFCYRHFISCLLSAGRTTVPPVSLPNIY